MHLQWAKQTDFDVKFIGLVRNPLAVMYSALKLFGTSPEARQFGWVEIQRNPMAFRQMVGKDQYYELRYEDLISEPALEFAKVCQFIGIDYEDVMGAEAHAGSLEKWRADGAFGLQLDPVVLQMASQFGYSPEELRNDHVDEGISDGSARLGPNRILLALRRVKARWLKPLLLKSRYLRGQRRL